VNSDTTNIALLRQWYAVARAMDRAITDVLVPLGLNETAGSVLWALDPNGQAPTMRDLARILSCDPSNASLISAKLEQEGLVERQPHPTDGRARVLVLTARGQELKDRLGEHLRTSTPLCRLDPSQQQDLSELLQLMS
jgi:DNA-binding MarR family transcriptional regulator